MFLRGLFHVIRVHQKLSRHCSGGVGLGPVRPASVPAGPFLFMQCCPFLLILSCHRNAFGVAINYILCYPKYLFLNDLPTFKKFKTSFKRHIY